MKEGEEDERRREGREGEEESGVRVRMRVSMSIHLPVRPVSSLAPSLLLLSFEFSHQLSTEKRAVLFSLSLSSLCNLSATSFSPFDHPSLRLFSVQVVLSLSRTSTSSSNYPADHRAGMHTHTDTTRG